MTAKQSADDGPDDYFDREVFVIAREAASAAESFWRTGIRPIVRGAFEFPTKHRTPCLFSWVDPEPVWCGAAWFAHLIESPDRPCKWTCRLSLAGGGQIRVTVPWVSHRDREGVWPGAPILSIAANDESRIGRFAARIIAVGTEVFREAVVSRSAPQDVLDRASATLQLIASNRENLVALFDASSGCAICGRPLRDEVSKALHIGPDCAASVGVQHNITSANAILARRRSLLGAGAMGAPVASIMDNIETTAEGAH